LGLEEWKIGMMDGEGILEYWNNGLREALSRFIRCPQTFNGEPGTITYELSAMSC